MIKMKTLKTLSIIASAVLLTSLISCSKNNSSDENSAPASSSTASSETSAASSTETTSTAAASTTDSKTTSTASSAATTATTSAATTTAAESTSANESTAPPATTTAPPKEEKKPGAPDAMSLAKSYYQAYLDHNAEAVYALFDQNEINGYIKAVEKELGEEDLAQYFSKDKIISAINKSISNVDDIKKDHSSSDKDKWSFKFKDEEFEAISEEDLKSYNELLGTSYSSASSCPVMYYVNDDNGDQFTGNSASFIEMDGRWFISFSNAISTDLFNFLDF